MSNLSILKTAIRQHENLFSLNDLHQVSGAENKHAPFRFIRLDTTQELISEIQQEDPNAKVILVKNGIGTYACEELALSYAMWISPKFHLVVLRAFIAMHKGELQNQQQTLPLVKNEIEVVEPTLTPKQQHQIQELVQGVHVHTEMSYAEIYSRLKNKFKVAKYDQIPQSRYREAIKYLGGLPMMDMPKPVELSMFEVLPLAIMLGHLRTLMVDFDIIHSQLKIKDDTLAKMLDNHYRQFNADTPLFNRVQSAIARLIDSLPEKEREFAFDMVYKI